jgi:hypothetical protein
MMGTHWYIAGKDAEQKRENAINEIRNKPIGEYGFLLKIETGKRTEKQRNSIEVYCRELAKALNDAGIPIKEEFLGRTLDIDWDQAGVKRRLWKGTQKRLFDIESTTKLTRAQVSDVYETINRYTAENFGIHVAFPENRARG